MSSIQKLYDLCQEKLHNLQEARILETDPSRKFKLQKEIEELKAQCEEFASNLGHKLRTGTGNNRAVNIQDSNVGAVITGDGNTLNISIGDMKK
ncbi:MAG: hypothetical protein PHP00_07035 [Thiotrichaceae bacterium]|nr:hypothetical protein [Thiotrichaceae bacterium]